jgi:hypothetical protein
MLWSIIPLESALKQNRGQVRASRVVVKSCRHQRHRLNNSKPALKRPAEQSRVRVGQEFPAPETLWLRNQCLQVPIGFTDRMTEKGDGLARAEALLAAKQQEKVRFIGFTGRKDPEIHLKMLSHDFPFDTIQMLLNCCDATFRSYERQVLPKQIGGA